MSRWIDAEWIRNLYADFEHYENRDDWTTPIANVLAVIDDAPSIDIADYVPKDFHDKTCEAMAKRHQEEIADMVSVVRCKECKHWDTADGECYADRGIYFPNANDFCSYGERRE